MMTDSSMSDGVLCRTGVIEFGLDLYLSSESQLCWTLIHEVASSGGEEQSSPRQFGFCVLDRLLFLQLRSFRMDE